MNIYSPELIRTCLFRPYRKGMGPVFRLRLWDLFRSDSDGKACVKYELSAGPIVIFSGDDFHCSPMHAIDSDACVESIMGFLTLRPGDTDADYFANYSELQKTFCAQHAEALACEVSNRFCDENGNVKEAKA